MKKRTILIVVILAVVFVGIVLGSFWIRQQRAASEKELITYQVGFGDFDAVIDETGSVYADQSATLSWQNTGVVGEVYVELGEEVKAGQVLAEIAEDSLPQSYYLAQQELIAATNALEDLYENASLVAANAQVELARAWEALYGADYRWSAIEPGQEPTEEELEIAKARAIIAENELEKKQNKYDDTTWDVAEAKALLELTLATNEYEQAVWYVDWLQAKLDEDGNDSEMEIQDPNILIAMANLDAAERAYEKVKDGPDPDDIRLAEARIAAAEASLDTASITAPFDGVITSVEVIEGDLVFLNTLAFRIDDLENLRVDVRVSEVDISQIEVGQPVKLVFDAIQGEEYQGEVVEVSPIGSLLQGLVTFQVSILVTDADVEVRPGLTAAVQIIVQQIEGALLIPNRAVRWVRGEQVVYLSTVDSDNPTAADLEIIPVTIGASSDEFTELIEGDINEGDFIVLNPPSVNIFDEIDPGGGPPSQFRQ
jgi:HlyD family secretion protein